MDTNQLAVIIQTILDEKGVVNDIPRIQKVLEKYTMNLTAEMDKKSLIKSVQSALPSVIKELHNIPGVQIPVDIDFSDGKLIEKACNQVEQANKRMQAEFTKTAAKSKEIQLSIDNGHGVSDYQNQINGLINDFQRYGVSVKEAETITSNLQTTFNNMKNMSGQELVNQADKFEQEFKSVKISFDQAKLAYDKLMQPASKEKVTSTLTKVQNLLFNNTRATKKVLQEWELYVNRLSSGSDITEKEINDINSRLKETKIQMQSMGRLGLSFGDSIKRGMGSFTQWVSATSVVMGSLNTVRKMISEVKELDNAQIELAKVSDLSAKGLSDVTKEAYKLGETVAKTGTQVLDAVTEFKRSGYDMSESMDFAEQALTMVNVAEGIDQASDAATALISIMKGYGDSSSDFAQKILDATNQVSNTQSINFDDLIDGSQRLAAVASQAGLSYEQMLGTLTGANEVLQNIEKTASGQITIFTRLQGIQLPDEEDVLPIAKLQKTINTATKGVVNVVDQSTGQLRNAYDVLDDINEIWDTLDKNTQEGIAFAAGGTRQKSVFLSMMENWENVEKAAASAMDSFGSATEENEKYLDSIAGKTANFASAFQQLSQTIINSDLVKIFIDLGTNGVKALDGLVSFITPLGALGATLGGIFGAKTSLDYRKKDITHILQGSGKSYCYG